MTYWARIGNRTSHAVLQILCLTLSKCTFILLMIMLLISGKAYILDSKSLMNQLEPN